MRRHSGQSIVEMAMVLPVLFFVIFGIIDLGYFIYGYNTLYQAARDGAAKASLIPPQPGQVQPFLANSNRADKCVANIMLATQQDATLFPDLTSTAGGSKVEIVYPKAATDSPRQAQEVYRKLGEPIEVRISYPMDPLTPLFRLINAGSGGKITINVTARRSIESLGDNPNEPDLQAC